MNDLSTILTILLSLFAITGSVWGGLKYYHQYRSKFLLITNCQILHKTLWKEIVKRYPAIKENAEQDHAFRPLIILPLSMKKYSSIANGQKAELESINPNAEKNLKIVAEVYWIPEDMEPWNSMPNPAFSLILRRYFGIERPMYQDETTEEAEKDENWKPVRHSRRHLDLLHKQDTKDGNKMLWAMNRSYTHRYWNPFEKKYERQPNDKNFIEYCGFSMVLRKRTWLHIDKD